MALQEVLTSITLPAGGNLSDGQFKFVKLATDGQVDVLAAATAATGVLQNKPSAAGQAATVAIGGISKVLAGGNINAGAMVECNASGEAVVLDAGVALGEAMEAGVDGKIIAVRLTL